MTTPTITGLRLTTVARDQVLTALTTGAAPTPPDTDNIDGAGAAPTWWMIAERPGDGYTVGRLAPGDSWHFADTFGAPARFDPSTFMHLRIFTSGTECLVVGVDTPAVWRTAITTEPPHRAFEGCCSSNPIGPLSLPTPRTVPRSPSSSIPPPAGELLYPNHAAALRH